MKHSRHTVAAYRRQLVRGHRYHGQWYPTTYDECVVGRRYPKLRAYGASKIIQCST